MKNKKTIILLLLIAIVGVVGLTLAYFANTASIENTFNTKQYGTTVDEVFTSPDDWTPGTTTDKTLTVTNSGNVDEAVRVSYTETWTSANSNTEGDLELSQGNNRAAIINFANSSDWTKVTENNKDYYYYNYKLAPGEVTSTLLDSVAFNSAITNSSNCTTSETATGKQVVCSSTGAGYDGATYKLVFTVETVQYDKYSEAWGTDASIAATKQLTVKGLKVNSTDKTYENGNKSAMFAFSHPQTEQMKSTTDYRYIGNVPNNYIYFNCDSSTNQSASTCEIWRIIGVFEVDDGTGTYQQRIKLVRGSAFATTMMWDDSSNNWPDASLNVFLNGDYLNSDGNASTYGLKELAQNQIADAKYYLGASNNTENIDSMYLWERGINSSGNSEINWVGKVALMYPSDQYMVYSKGVDTICYENPGHCVSWYDGNPNYGWIYNSNNLDNGNDDPQTTFLLLKHLDYETKVYTSDSSGYLSNDHDDIRSSIAVRPVVYLKPSIQITGGTGESTNPYTLSAN